MVLDAEDGELPVDQTFHCSVVQIQVGQAEVRSSGNLQLLPRNDGEPVVLRRDLDRVPIEVANRVVPAVVPVVALKFLLQRAAHLCGVHFYYGPTHGLRICSICGRPEDPGRSI